MNIDTFEPIPFIKSILIAIFSFISPVWGLFLMVGIAVVIDTAYAIYCAVVKRGWKAYDADKLEKLVPKTFFYMSTMLLAFCIDKFVVSTNIVFGVEWFFTKSISVIWVYLCVKSIDQNSVKMGNKSIYIIVKKFIKEVSSLKNEITNVKD